MPVSPARAAAFEILLRIETTDAYASELLHSSRFAKLSPADHGLLTELVMGVLRWRGVLDKKIGRQQIGRRQEKSRSGHSQNWIWRCLRHCGWGSIKFFFLTGSPGMLPSMRVWSW